MTGCRIPTQYFITSGSGETDYGSPLIPFEGGSYDKALLEAGICNVNIITYTSMIPKNCKKLDRKNGIAKLQFGCVLECIMSVINGTKGQQIFAGLLITKIHDQTLSEIGSFVIEYGDYHNSKAKALSILFHQLQNMIENRGFGKIPLNHLKLKKMCKTDLGFIIYPEEFITKTMKVEKNFGTVITAIGFPEFNYLN
jgi:arginine decarboxylase